VAVLARRVVAGLVCCRKQFPSGNKEVDAVLQDIIDTLQVILSILVG
jgi:hypothetical protein